MKDGNNQYAPLRGHPVLLEATAAYLKPSLGDELKQENIMITIGATEGLFIAIKAIINPGDVVVAFEPGYTCYRTQTEYSGGKYVTVPLHITEEGGWVFKGEEVRAALTKAKIFVINSPHNPTGKIFSPSELEELASILN